MAKTRNEIFDPATPGQPQTTAVELPENIVGATDWYELRQAEDVLGGVRGWQVTTHQPHIPGDFGTAHLADIHAHVLQDVYPIVGETRNDTLIFDKQEGKQSDPPATHRIGVEGQTIALLPADQVNKRLDELAREIKEANELRGLNKPDFTQRFTEVYTKYAQAHPFENGTRPVLAATMGLIAEEAGYKVDINRAPGLQRETDAVLANGEAADPRRLRAILGAVIEEDQSELGALRRRITLQVVKPKPPPEQAAENSRLELVQASLPFIARNPGPESNPLRSSLRAVYEGDDSHTNLTAIRLAVRSQGSPEMSRETARVEAAANQVDNFRDQRQKSPAFEKAIQAVRGSGIASSNNEITR